MATVVNRSNPALTRAVSEFGGALTATIASNRKKKRLHEERTAVEQGIREAPDFQSALTSIEGSSRELREQFEPELMERAKARFPEMELMPALDAQGRVTTRAHPRGQPLSDDDLTAQGLSHARQMAIVSHDAEGNIELHDVALGGSAGQSELEMYQEMFPDRRVQLVEGPETETFMEIWKTQLRAREERTARLGHKVTPTDQMFEANIRAELANDPLATEDGAKVLESKRDDIRRRFESFNGQFEGTIFSLEEPESAALVQNGIANTSALIARGHNLESATDVGFNSQIAGSIISNLLKQRQPDSAVAQEGQRRFGVNPGTLQSVMNTVAQTPAFAELGEYDPKSNDPDVIAVPVAGTNVTLRFAKVNGRLVPLGRR